MQLGQPYVCDESKFSGQDMLFDEYDLPRFGIDSPIDEAVGGLKVWWSIASLDADNDGGEFYFYATGSDTELAMVSADASIEDAAALMYSSETLGPLAIGNVVIWHQHSSGRYVALRVVSLYGTETDRRSECTAIDARWQFAVPGTARFPRLP